MLDFEIANKNLLCVEFLDRFDFLTNDMQDINIKIVKVTKSNVACHIINDILIIKKDEYLPSSTFKFVDSEYTFNIINVSQVIGEIDKNSISPELKKKYEID